MPLTSIAPNWVETPDSSQIIGFGYDAEEMKLTIQFKTTGAAYDYFDVPKSAYDELCAAESKGRCFGKTIKGVYWYQRRS